MAARNEKVVNRPINYVQDSTKNVTSGFGFSGSNFLIVNFCLMALLFSANHGTVVALVGIASTVQKKQSGVQNAVFYSAYTLSSLLFANLFVAKLGSKGAILLGMSTYCIYSGCFLAMHYTTDDTFKWILIVFSSVMSGAGAGGLWTAQASFFSESAKKHAQLTGQSVKKATTLYATIFPCFYLSMELLMRILSSVIKIAPPAENATASEIASANHSKITLFTIYAGVAAVSTVLMFLFVKPMKVKVERVPILEKILGMFVVMVTDPRILLMAPYNFTFSFASSFLNEYVNSKIISPDDIGWFGAALVGSAIICSTGFGTLIKNTSIPKMIPMIAGSLAFLGFTAFLFFLTNTQLENQLKYLIPMYILFGCGRGIWESTMKAVFADFFGDIEQPAAAFANIPFQNGLAGASGFLIFGTIKSTDARVVGTWSVTIIGVLGIVCYFLADLITRKKRRVNNTHVNTHDDATDSLIGNQKVSAHGTFAQNNDA